MTTTGGWRNGEPWGDAQGETQHATRRRQLRGRMNAAGFRQCWFCGDWWPGFLFGACPLDGKWL